MRPSTIWYTLKQGIKNIKRNWMFSLASIITDCLDLFVRCSFIKEYCDWDFLLYFMSNIVYVIHDRKEN